MTSLGSVPGSRCCTHGKRFCISEIPPSASTFPILITHPIALEASFIAAVNSENEATSAAVVGPIVGKLKGISSALDEYLNIFGKIVKYYECEYCFSTMIL